MSRSSYARGAGMLCRNPLLREFFTETTGRQVFDAEAAAQELRLACAVESRRELDQDIEAGRRYLALVEQFNDWLGTRRA